MTYVSINPGTVEDAGDSKDFSALVKIISSRYSTSSALFQNSAYEDKIVVQWKFLTVNDKEFSQSYSTGLKVDDGLADISPDGKRLISKSGDFSGFGPKSDATLLIRKAIQAGFPSALVVDDISVFEGHAFFVKDASNPAVSQSRPKPYPKEYKKQGWDLAKNAALEARYAKAAANSSYNPSKGLADAQPGSPAQYNPHR